LLLKALGGWNRCKILLKAVAQGKVFSSTGKTWNARPGVLGNMTQAEICACQPRTDVMSRTLRAFVWQPDLLMVVRYIYDCFQFRARILNPCVDVPSNQPHLAGLI
jgi:hypothetical protein